MNPKRERRGTLILIIGCMFWGLSGTCGQYLFSYKGIESGWLVMARTIISGLVLSAVCLVRRDRNYLEIWKNKGDILRLLIFSFFGLLLSQYSYLTAIYYTNAGTATILQQVSPVIIIAVLCIRQRRLPQKKEIICIMLALAGSYLIATKGNPASLALSPWGLFWGFMSAVGVVTYSFTSQKLVGKYGSIPVTAQGMLISGIVFALISGQYRVRVEIDIQMIFPLFGVIILGTVLAYTMFMAGVSRCGPFKAAVLGTIEPVSAVVFSCVWMKTQITVYDITGGVMILSLVIIQNLPAKKNGNIQPEEDGRR